MFEFKTQIDIRKYPAKDRYPAVAQAFRSLKSGEKMELINDHDIRPLLQYKFSLDFPSQYDWIYLVEGPEEWHAAVTRK